MATMMRGHNMFLVLGLVAMRASAGHAFPAAPASPQLSFEQAVHELSSPDTGTRRKAVQVLRDAAYAEAAAPLARLVVDPEDDVQLDAIAAELNIFMAEKVVTRKRVGFIVEVRTPLEAEPVFTAGPLVIGPWPVPMEVLDALRVAARDDNPRVRLEAVYAFGVLAAEAGGERRRELLRVSGPDLASMIGAVDIAHRYAALRVLGRVFARRPGDLPIEQTVGDAVISALNEPDAPMRAVAMQALGAMRYERALPGLTDLLQHYRKGEMAKAALDALAHIAHQSSVPQLATQLTSKSSALRTIAIEGLARAGDRTKLADIQTAVQMERNESLLLAGTFASMMLSVDAVDSVAPIVNALSKPRLRDQARGYLAEAAFDRPEMLARYLQGPSAVVRADIVDALGLGGDSAALAFVEPMSADGDVIVTRATERAVARLRQVARAGA